MSTLANTTTRYGTVAKVFHWTVALLILALIPLGLIASNLSHGPTPNIALSKTLFSIHKTLGVTVFFVALLRILWAITQPKPGSLHPDRKAETFLAELVHWLLYASLVLVPLTGWITHAASDEAIFAGIWWPFGQNLPFVPESVALAEVAAGLHVVFERVLVVSILLHVAGAVKHHVIDKDDTLRRMWFGRTETPLTGSHQSSLAPPVVAVGVLAAAIGAGALLGVYGQSTEAAELAEVESEWTVSDGTLALSITQFGNPVEGQFGNWTADISFDPGAADPKGFVTVTIDIASLDLGSVSAQAMGTDYFDVETHPTAVFAAEIRSDGDGYIAEGTLTVKEIALPISLPFTLELDGETAVMTGETVVNRRDYEIGAGNSDTDLAPEVAITVNLTATKGAAPE